MTEEVTDEFCSNNEYDEPSKVEESEKDTVIYEHECWVPGNKWIVQDVYNHLGESLNQMFLVLKLNQMINNTSLMCSKK